MIPAPLRYAGRRTGRSATTFTQISVMHRIGNFAGPTIQPPTPGPLMVGVGLTCRSAVPPYAAHITTQKSLKPFAFPPIISSPFEPDAP